MIHIFHSKKRNLLASIVFIIATLSLLQFAIIKGIQNHFQIKSSFFPLFSFLSHLILCFFLLSRHSEMYNTHTKKSNLFINLPNTLTSIRISSAPTLCFLLVTIKNHTLPSLIPLLIGLSAFGSLTDFFDGVISRRFSQETPLGKKLDSMADYFLLGTMSTVFLIYGMLSTFTLIVFIIRFTFQFFAVITLGVFLKKKPTASTLLGKITIFTITTLYNVALLSLIPSISEGVLRIMPFLESLCIALTFLSFIERVKIFIKDSTQEPVQHTPHLE